MAFTNIGGLEFTYSATTSASDTAAAAIPDLGENTIGYVSVHLMPGTSQTIDSCTWDGAAMTAGATATNGQYVVKQFYLANPADNGTKNIVATYNTSAIHNGYIVVGWASAAGAITLDDTSTETGTTTSPDIVSTQSVVDTLVVSASCSDANSIAAGPVTDCTELHSYDQGGNCAIVAYSRPEATGDVTHVHNYGASGAYAIVSISFKAAASGTAGFPKSTTPTYTLFASSVTSMPVNMPGSLTSGDLLIAWVSVRNAGTWTVPTDWTEIAGQAGGGSVGELSVFYKISAGTEGATQTWTASVSTTAVWHVRKFTDWHGTTPPEITTSSGDSSSADPPSLTPSWGSDNTTWIAAASHSAASAAAFTADPTNYADYLNSGASSGGSAVSIATAWRENAATSEDPGTFTAGGSNRWWASATVAIRPVESGGGGATYPGYIGEEGWF